MATRPTTTARSMTALSPRPARHVGRARPEGTPFTMTLPAPAKVNLFLEVLGKRPDGFHELNTCMVGLDLCDTLSFAPAHDLELTCDESSLTTGEDNLILKAARQLQRHTGCPQGAAIHLTKRIPMEAGLGGGSSDAATTLRGLNELWELHLPTEELQSLAAELGSDVPYFVTGGAAWCTGRGEQVMPFELKSELSLVLICPNRGLSTAEVYRRLNAPKTVRADVAMKLALSSGDAAAIGTALFNRLEEPALPLLPLLAQLKQQLTALAASQPILGHQMSGSGSTYFVLCPSLVAAQQVAAAVRALGDQPRGQDDPGFSLLVVRSRRPRN